MKYKKIVYKISYTCILLVECEMCKNLSVFLQRPLVYYMYLTTVIDYLIVQSNRKRKVDKLVAETCDGGQLRNVAPFKVKKVFYSRFKEIIFLH